MRIGLILIMILQGVNIQRNEAITIVDFRFSIVDLRRIDWPKRLVKSVK